MYDYQDNDGFDPDEEAANLQSEMIDAARALINEHDWTIDDVIKTLKATCG